MDFFLSGKFLTIEKKTIKKSSDLCLLLPLRHIAFNDLKQNIQK